MLDFQRLHHQHQFAHLGNVILASGGRALLNGTFDNTSATLTAPTGGLFELYGGTIVNGAIAAGALSFTSSGGTLSNVSYTGDFTLPASTNVTCTTVTIFTGHQRHARQPSL